MIIVASGSRESKNKAEMLTQAALSLGVEVQRVDVHSLDFQAPKLKSNFVISTSDGCNHIAGEIAKHSHIPYYTGIGEHSKSGSYRALKRAGFPVLWFSEINSNRHLRSLIGQFEGAVFVKPEDGSAGFDRGTLGYKRFDSLAELHKSVCKQGIELKPGQYMVMEYIEFSTMYCLSAALRPNAADCFGNAAVFLSPDAGQYRGMLFAEFERVNQQIRPRMKNLWAAGFRAPMMYLQCAAKNGVLYPIDANTRMSTFLDSYCTHYDPTFYTRLLEFWLFNKPLTEPDAQSAFVVGRLLQHDPYKPWAEVRNLPESGIHWLHTNVSMPAAGGFDLAYSRPTYAIFDDDIQRILARHEAIQANAVVV